MRVIAFTRPEDRLWASETMAEGMGFKAVTAPSLQILPVEEACLLSFSERLRGERYDCLIFTSATAVEKVFNFFDDEHDYVSIMNGMEIVAIGLPTKNKLQEKGIERVAIPDDYTSEGLVLEFGRCLAGKKLCLLRSDKGTDVLRGGLESFGSKVDEAFVYRLEPAPVSEKLRSMVDSAARGMIDAFAFSSPLSAKSFFENAVMISDEDTVRGFLSRSFVAAIGNPTFERLLSIGIRVDLVPSKADFEVMLREIKQHFESLEL